MGNRARVEIVPREACMNKWLGALFSNKCELYIGTQEKKQRKRKQYGMKWEILHTGDDDKRLLSKSNNNVI